MHYNGTHFPYVHADRFSVFRPELPADFEFDAAGLAAHPSEISNRYRNCLREADAWIASLVASIDLSSTILVITGDHGEEFGERKRFGHAGARDEPQLRTIAAIIVPGRKAADVWKITSHVDIMPTILEAVGLPQPTRPFGHSLLTPAAGDSVGSAVSAMVSREDGPRRWAVITATGKLLLDLPASAPPRVHQVLGPGDTPASFREAPGHYQAALDAAANLIRARAACATFTSGHPGRCDE
jgi:arylsulfatase A-like enzyme